MHSHVALKWKRLKAIARRRTTVRRTIDVSGFGDRQQVTFEREIMHSHVWSGQAALSLGGSRVWTSTQLNDHYGVDGMIEALGEHAAERLAKFGSNVPLLELQLLVDVEDTFLDVVQKTEFPHSSEEAHDAVLEVPRDWVIEGFEPTFPGRKRTFEIGSSEGSEPQALIETVALSCPAETVHRVRASICTFFASRSVQVSDIEA